MASFFRKYSSVISNKDWFKEDMFFKESSNKASNPKSPLNMDFEKETGVTIGLGLVPYLANLWIENPNAERIVFSIKMGLQDFSRSLIRDSVSNTYELITFNLNSPTRLFSCPRTPSSLFSSLSHTPLMGSQQDIWDLPDDLNELPIDPHYFFFLRDECHDEDELSFGSDDDFDTKNDVVLNLSYSNEHESIYDSMRDDQKINNVAYEEDDIGVIGGGRNQKPNHMYDNNNFVERPRSFVSGCSATFGFRANRHAAVQQKDDQTMKQCDELCKKTINMEENESVFFKSKYSCSCSKQCYKKVKVDNEEDWKKAFSMAPK